MVFPQPISRRREGSQRRKARLSGDYVEAFPKIEFSISARFPSSRYLLGKNYRTLCEDPDDCGIPFVRGRRKGRGGLRRRVFSLFWLVCAAMMLLGSGRMRWTCSKHTVLCCLCGCVFRGCYNFGVDASLFVNGGVVCRRGFFTMWEVRFHSEQNRPFFFPRLIPFGRDHTRRRARS